MPPLRLTVGQGNILWDDQAAILAAIAGTGGGKTRLTYSWLRRKMKALPNHTWGYAEPTYDMLRKIIIHSPDPQRPDLISYFKSIHWNPHYIRVAKIIETDYGQIYLGSADKPESLQGAAVAGYVLDEGGQMSLYAFETALQRVAMYEGQVLIATTPYNRGWLKTEIFDKAGEDDIHVERWRSIDRPDFPKERYDLMKRRMSSHRFSMMFDAEFEQPEGLVFKCFDRMKHTCKPFPIPDDWTVYCGMDFGWNHPTAIIWIAEDHDGNYYVFKEYKKGQRSIAEHLAEAFGNKDGGYDYPSKIFADPSGKQFIEEIRRKGFNIVGANNDTMAGRDAVTTAINEGRFKVFDNLKHIFDEFESYQYSEKDGVYQDTVLKENDDLMDALRYDILGISTRKVFAFEY